MDSAMRLAAKFRIPVKAVESLAEHWNMPLGEATFEVDAAFERAAYDLKRGNLTAYAVAYYMRKFSEEDEARIDMLEAMMPDDGQSIVNAWGQLIYKTIDKHKLAGAQLWLDRASEPDPEALEHLATWAKASLADAPGEVDYLYLAVRLMLSLPEKVAVDYPKPIQAVINRLKHYGYLDGWHRIERDAKRRGKTIYHAAKNLLTYDVTLLC